MPTLVDLPRHQNTADYLKSIVIAIKAPNLIPLRRRVLSLIVIFERNGFHDRGFLDVFDKLAPPLLIERGKISRLPDADDRAVLESIETLLEQHLVIVDPTPREVFTTETAAAYLGISKEGVNYHQKMGNLVGRLLGHTRIYTKDELDHFTTTRRTAGRPAKELT